MSQTKNQSKSKRPYEEAPTVSEQDAAPAAAAQQAPPPEPEVSPERLRSAEEERDACKDRYVRLAAEYENFRKRSAREREALYAEIQAETAAQFLSVFDNLERALAHPTEDAAYAQGVEMIRKGLLDVFGKLGIVKMEALGAPFDPNAHNAVMHVEDENTGANTVVEVFSQGFVMGDKVIRPAVVKVAN